MENIRNNLTLKKAIKLRLNHVCQSFRWISRLFLSRLAIHVRVKVATRIDCRLLRCPSSHGNLCASLHAGRVSRFQECWWTSVRVTQTKHPPPPPPLLFFFWCDCMLFPLTQLRMSPWDCVSFRVVSHWVTGRILTMISRRSGFVRLHLYLFFCLWESTFKIGYQPVLFDSSSSLFDWILYSPPKTNQTNQQRMDLWSPWVPVFVDYSVVHCGSFVFQIQSNLRRLFLSCLWPKRVICKRQMSANEL